MESFRTVLNDTVSVGHMVMNALVDWIGLKGGNKAESPLVAFEIKGVKISERPSYYDIATFQKQIS